MLRLYKTDVFLYGYRVYQSCPLFLGDMTSNNNAMIFNFVFFVGMAIHEIKIPTKQGRRRWYGHGRTTFWTDNDP